MFTNHPTLKLRQAYQTLLTLPEPEQIDNGLRFPTEWGDLELTLYAPRVLRLRLETAPLPEYGLLAAKPSNAIFKVQQVDTIWSLVGEGIGVAVDRLPYLLKLLDGGKTILETSTDMSLLSTPRLPALARGKNNWLVSFALEGHDPVYGLGEKFSSINRRGQLVVSSNEDATGVNAEFSYKNVPFAWSPRGWGLMVHTPGKVTHGVGYAPWSHRSYVLQIEDPNLDLFFISGKNPAEILERYTWLTGRTAIPPRWGYGVWMSRAFYNDAQETLQSAQNLREHHIPADVIVLDGRAWHKIETRFDFQWDPERYPDPAAFVQVLKENDFRLCLWEYPFVARSNPLFDELESKGYLLKDDQGTPCLQTWRLWPLEGDLPHLPPSGVIDFTNPDAYEWYKLAHQALFKMGVAVMKVDYGEALPEQAIAFNGERGKRLHNVYALLYNRCVFEATQQGTQGEAMVWGRAGWIGSQRYPVQWGGDPQSDWEGLAASIRGGLSWGMSGGPFYAHDVGGFTAVKPDAELYVRWAQAGVLSSHMRFHGLGPREPWVFGQEVETIVKRWLELRYRLIPYLQACAMEAKETGMPVMRAMPLAFPGDMLCANFEEQYLLGPSLFVAPVLEPGGKTTYYLPPGRWFDFWSGELIEGPRLVDAQMPLDQIPIFGREGHLLPLGPVVQHTGELRPELDLEEVWSFGVPCTGMTLPGLRLEPGSKESGVPLTGLPSDVKLRIW